MPVRTGRVTWFVVAVAVALVTVASGWLAAATPRLAPDVTLQSADGARVQLATYKGKVVLVDFWASWCPPCKTSFPALDLLYREYQPRGVEVLAVNLDERRRDADAFLGDHPYRLTVLFDPKGASPLAFGVKGMPSSFLIDKAGNVRFTHMGYSGNVDESYRREIAQLLTEP
jgi:cytochrome c biogenesis protein CcmG/thiol:disulfide interchange protein DsbE